MKVDKRNPKHWGYLILFGCNVVLALLLRPFLRQQPRRALLYGHKLNGNLLAMYRAMVEASDPWNVAFLTMDPNYYRRLIETGQRAILAISPRALWWLCRSGAVVSDHGLHVLSPMVSLSSLKFFDVWHGIPFKGFDEVDFRLQHRYDEIWVASPLLARMYADRFGFPPGKVEITGYARTDRLILADKAGTDTSTIKRRLGLDKPDAGKVVLFAPTWKQDASERSIFPFGVDEQTFFSGLSALATRFTCTFVVRAHLNSDNDGGGTWERIVQLPHADFPDTEELLLVSDVLVCDWSSIAFDYLLLDRPTLFLDVPAPFAKGFSLGPEYRFGAIITNMCELDTRLGDYLHDPADYYARFGAAAARVRQTVYGAYADGQATARCIERLRHHLVRE